MTGVIQESIRSRGYDYEVTLFRDFAGYSAEGFSGVSFDLAVYLLCPIARIVGRMTWTY